MFSGLRQLSQQLAARLPSIVPSSCALCGVTADTALCPGCESQFDSCNVPRCARCAARLPVMSGIAMSAPSIECGECLNKPPAFDATIVVVDYAPPLDQLVLALKFAGRLALAPLFARMLRDALLHARSDQVALPTMLTAVPLGANRLAERGFNQALEIAKPLSRTLGIGLDAHLVARSRNTHAQALLHPDDRRKNLRGAFVVPPAAIDRVRGQHIGVVDDVITTGETLNELAATLKRFGASRVTNLVFARTAQK